MVKLTFGPLDHLFTHFKHILNTNQHFIYRDSVLFIDFIPLENRLFKDSGSFRFKKYYAL